MKSYGMQLFLYGITDEQRNERRQKLIEVEADQILEAGQSLMKDIEQEKTKQTIFGANVDKLQFFISRGWRIERFVEGLSLKSSNYTPELPQAQQVGNSVIREANEFGVAEFK